MNPKGMLVEYLQYEFLDSLFKQAGSESLSFIGGTAVRIIYNSQRFSEDLDFDNFGLSHSALKKLMEKTCREMELKGVQLEVRHLAKAKTYHCYIKFPEILRSFGLPAHHLQKIFVGVDAERKKEIAAPEIKALNKFGIFRNIRVNPAPVLLAQKLIAILFRKREKGRDFYDASFLGGLARPDYAYIKKVLIIGEDEFKAKLIRRCGGFNYSVLAKDVAPFLFNEDQKERVLNFSKALEGIL